MSDSSNFKTIQSHNGTGFQIRPELAGPISGDETMNHRVLFIEEENSYSHKLPILVDVPRIPEPDEASNNGLSGSTKAESVERRVGASEVRDSGVMGGGVSNGSTSPQTISIYRNRTNTLQEEESRQHQRSVHNDGVITKGEEEEPCD